LRVDDPVIGAQDLACEGRVLLLGDLAMNKLGNGTGGCGQKARW
jgi:hypothetical protein